MCLPEFEGFKQIKKVNAVIGYRTWKNQTKDSLILKSEHRNYEWKRIEDLAKIYECKVISWQDFIESNHE